jgi:hypothetical protein
MPPAITPSAFFIAITRHAAWLPFSFAFIIDIAASGCRAMPPTRDADEALAAIIARLAAAISHAISPFRFAFAIDIDYYADIFHLR